MYHDYLNSNSAQKIADGIMKIIPYNINIMNNDGIIIASGDKSRINTIHKGAVKALKMHKPYVVYEDTKTERRGINLPILYNQNIVGVIGISGNVNEVMRIGQIVVVMAQLMIENQIFNSMIAIKESRLKDFLYDWISLKQSDYTGEFLDQANYFGIDLSMPRTAVIITCQKVRYSVMQSIKQRLEPNEYIVRQRMEDVLLLLNSNSSLKGRLEKILALSKDLLSCYIGEASIIASQTTESAVQTYQIAQALNLKDKILHFEEVALECLFNNLDKNTEMEHIMELFEKKDTDGILKQTICVYVEFTYDYRKICERLHIHRNTLNYRLTKIEEVFGKNPRCARDLMILYIAVIKLSSKRKLLNDLH